MVKCPYVGVCKSYPTKCHRCARNEELRQIDYFIPIESKKWSPWG